MTRGLFISGTNTNVGKSYVGALIAKQLTNAGHKVGVYKPVESGCREEKGQLIAADAELLWQAAGKPGELEHVCPQRFAAPLAPPQAAANENRRVDEQLLRSGLHYWLEQSDIVLVEGAGGLMSPISSEDYNINLAQDLGLPLVIVSLNELGTINATLQTAITARALAPELPIAGIILNQKATLEEDPSILTNASELRDRASVPVLASIEYEQGELSDGVDWMQISQL